MSNNVSNSLLSVIEDLQSDGNEKIEFMADSLADVVFYLIKMRGSIGVEDSLPIDKFLNDLGFVRESILSLKKQED